MVLTTKIVALLNPQAANPSPLFSRTWQMCRKVFEVDAKKEAKKLAEKAYNERGWTLRKWVDTQHADKSEQEKRSIMDELREALAKLRGRMSD